MRYKIYYKPDLDSKDIINVLIPPQRVEEYVSDLDKKMMFYTKLQKSLEEEGFRNPILITAGECLPVRRRWMPEGWERQRDKLLVCDICGGSRLYLAKKNGWKIPAIISDFVGYFENDDTVTPLAHDLDDIVKYFKDPPQNITLKKEGVFFTRLKPVHMYRRK